MTPAGVRHVRASEIDAWCACPLRPDDAGFDAWVEGEHAWVRRRHGERPTLFAFETGGAFLGKYDLPIEEEGRWRLWAPSARNADVMRALCDHVLAGSGKAGIGAVEVVLESAHRNRELAREALLRAGFSEAEERVVVARDLARPLPSCDLAGLAFRSGTATDDLLRRCGAGGPVPDSALTRIARLAGRDVGVALPCPDEPLTIHHLGLVPEARGKGLGAPLLVDALRAGHEAGCTSYVGSTAKGNAPMLRLFERTGCHRVGDRWIFRAPGLPADP